MTRRMIALGLIVVTAACTEKLTTPGDCPALCPGGIVDVRDTVLTAVPSGDSSFTGYQGRNEVLSLLVSDGGQYGQSRAVVRFVRRGDSVFVRDTSRAFTVDSVVLSFVLQRRDTTVGGMVLEVYRLPFAVDTLTSFAAIDGAMTPATLLEEYPIADNARAGVINVTLGAQALARIAFTPSDSSRLTVGLRIRSAGGGAARFGALFAGGEAPVYTTFATVAVADTALRRQRLVRVPELNFTTRPDFGPPAADLLTVGGFPAARSFIRFALPAFLRDSATILRATLELVPSVPIVGIPADTARLDVRQVIADFGAKSPVASDRFAVVPLVPGSDTIRVDIVGLVQLWQGSAPLPSIVRLSLGREGATFIAPRFGSTRAGTPPRLRITYRRPFPFEGL